MNEVLADEYFVKVKLRPGYVWEDGTTEDKELPWVILPLGDDPKDPEIIENPKDPPDNPLDDGTHNSYEKTECGCCCCCGYNCDYTILNLGYDCDCGCDCNCENNDYDIK